eukprot:scaffold216334_cov32-Tisochrysis_lutea.AAC.3
MRAIVAGSFLLHSRRTSCQSQARAPERHAALRAAPERARAASGCELRIHRDHTLGQSSQSSHMPRQSPRFHSRRVSAESLKLNASGRAGCRGLCVGCAPRAHSPRYAACICTSGRTHAA